MIKVSARALDIDVAFPRGSEMLELKYGLGELSVHVQGTDNETPLVINFKEVIALRVLDERDLMEYWPECSTPNGWIFEVIDGGWLSQEASRQGSLISAAHPQAKEYLITGADDCVSVICLNEPAVYRNAL